MQLRNLFRLRWKINLPVDYSTCETCQGYGEYDLVSGKPSTRDNPYPGNAVICGDCGSLGRRATINQEKLNANG